RTFLSTATATSTISPLSLHDALPISAQTGHLVIDIDGPEGEAAARALGLLSEPTLTVTTSRGRHLWFQHPGGHIGNAPLAPHLEDRKSTRLNSSHQIISYAVFCLKKK